MIRFLALTIAQFSGKARQCMRLGAALAMTCVIALSARAALADHSASVVIHDAERTQITASAHFWHEKPAKASIEQASDANAAARYMPLAEETMFNLKPQDRLWIRLDIDRKSAAPEHTILWLPLPLLDVVTLYQQGADGKWSALKAGDRIPVASWPEPGRYPRFHLDLPQGKSSVFLQVQGSTPLSLPLYLGTEVQAQAADREGFLGMGLIVGVLLTLVLMCMVTAYTYKDRLYLLYGIYMLVMILAVGAYTGISSYLLWNQSPIWADAAQGALAILTAGGALYFIEALLGGRQFARKLSILLLSLGVISLPLALLYCFVPRSAGVVILGIYMISVSAIGLTLASQAWQRGDQVGKWICLAYTPLALAVLLAIARAFGWISVSWVVQYGVVVALMIEAPMMMVALNLRSRERHEINTREQAMATQDALTGLLKEHIFDDRIRQTMARSIKRREDAAIVLISLVNYELIAQAHGSPVAEQSVLRAVIKLRKVIRDVETVARVGTSHFGLILEGVGHRSRITEVGARLIAQGLMPLPGLVPEVTLQFHMAAVLMRDLPAEQRDIKEELLTLLGTMSRRTRRPIRFWELTTTGGTPLMAMPVASSPVDQLAAQVQAASSRAPSPVSTANSDVPSSGSGWDSTNQADSSVIGGDTVQLPRSRM
jgi:two-component system, sensor histidine kinase LadS